MLAARLAPLYRLAGRPVPERRRTPRAARDQPVALLRRRVFILPTRQGLLFAVILLTMLLGSLNYNNSMGFVLSFLLMGMGFVTILHTYRNLARLEISAGKSSPVFAGESALFNIIVNNPRTQPRLAIILQLRQQNPVLVDVPGKSLISVPLAQPSVRRGLLKMERLTLSTRFPLGLLCAWSHLGFDPPCMVYPAPRGARALSLPSQGENGQYAFSVGNDDFAGQRNYRPGDPLAHVNWKAAARGRGLLIKEFAGAEAGTLWLDWDDFSGLEGEARLSQLSKLVLDADTAGYAFGLRLPGQSIAAASGSTHRHACLSALALFKVPIVNTQVAS